MIKINSVKAVVGNRRSYMCINFNFKEENIKIKLGIYPVTHERARMTLDVTQVPGELEDKKILEKFLESNALRFLESYKHRDLEVNWATILLRTDEYYAALKELGWSPNDNQLAGYRSDQEYGWFPVGMFPEVDNYIPEQISNHI